jgi:mono/diheme cytochrome c family protein
MALGLGVEYTELMRGHATYMSHCARCHERVPPGKVDPEFWRGIVPHMAARAEIGEAAERELLLYLMAAHGTVHGLDLEH